ncbi:MAG: hypothetical protein FVQ85_07535 [Planctomycetes bacterium]|nr:hypothetical protein [Planctomycetota bacterium]
MQTRVVRFTLQLALVGVIISFTIGRALVAQRIEKVDTPRSAGSSECFTILQMLNLPEPLTGVYWHKSPQCRTSPNQMGANLKLNGRVLGTPIPIASARPLEKSANDVSPDYNILDAIIADSLTQNAQNIEDYGPTPYLQQDKETITKMDDEQSAMLSSEDEVIATIATIATETLSDPKPSDPKPVKRNIEQTSNTVNAKAQAKQVLTEVRTKMKYIETMLKKSVLESYRINGQIVGYRITGLDKILVAKDLLLKSGDIIRVVNGQQLSSKKIAYKIFKKARKRPIMEIELLRDGKSRTLLYYLR